MFKKYMIMANTINFKAITVSGVNKAEALSSVTDRFTVVGGNVKGDATQAWKRYRETHDGVIDIKQFMAEYLANKKAIPGEAYTITEVAAVADTRQRPFAKKSIKNTGKRTANKAFVFIDAETGVELGRLSATYSKVKNPDTGEVTEKKHLPTKGEALKYVEKLIKDGDEIKFRGTVRIEEIKEVTNPVVAEVSYAPSKASQVGTWVVFGVEKN